MVLALCLAIMMEVTPLDAVRVNLASIQADVEFTIESGFADRSAVSNLRALKGEIGLVPDRNRTIVGLWECDGTSQHFSTGPLPDVELSARELRKTARVVSTPRLMEGIFDGDLAAWHSENVEGSKILHVKRVKDCPGYNHGPLSWLSPQPFPESFDQIFPNSKPTYSTISRDGRPYELATYSRPVPQGWVRGDVRYDPSVGYLPRFARIVDCSKEMHGVGLVAEFHLIEARPCAAGGFVPMEWYEIKYDVDAIESHYKAIDDATRFAPNRDRVVVDHFRATALRDRNETVKLTRLKQIGLISGLGGSIALAKPPVAMTLTQVVNLLGRKNLEPSPRVFPALDNEELHRFEVARSRPWWPYATIGAGALILIVVLIGRWRTRGLWAVLFVVFMGSGCNREPSKPVIRLAADFTKPSLLYEPGRQVIDAELVVRNVGNRGIHLTGANGGCACRQVDRSKLPIDLAPGQRLALGVQLTDRKDYRPQTVTFNWETESGELHTPVDLLAIPRHDLSPEVVSIAADSESGAMAFDLVHRQVLEGGAVWPRCELVLPPRFTIVSQESRKGRMADAPDYQCLDTTYHLRLADQELGTRKESIALEVDGTLTPIHAEVVWRRRAYLSCTPGKVLLGSKPVRTFLVCADQAIELTRTISSPSGVKAVVSSPREVTVSLADEAPGVIDGVIEVGTTAAGKPPLKIPVVRYAPLAKK